MEEPEITEKRTGILLIRNRARLDQMTAYLNTPTVDADLTFNILKYWESNVFVNLTNFAIDLSIVPGTSCSVERLFSLCKLVDTEKRQKMDKELKCKLILTKSWIKMEELWKLLQN